MIELLINASSELAVWFLYVSVTVIDEMHREKWRKENGTDTEEVLEVTR